MAYTPKADKRNTTSGMTPNKSIKRGAPPMVKKPLALKTGRGR